MNTNREVSTPQPPEDSRQIGEWARAYGQNGALDRVIHEPVRLRIMAILSGVDRADFKFFLSTLGLSKGNLASHIDKLERAGYVEVHKSFLGKVPHTEYRLTATGRSALASYWAALDAIRSAFTDRPRGAN